jgi:hypothetical protein
MAGTQVQAVVITNAGTGYTSNPTVSFANASGDTAGISAAATAAAIALTTPVHFFQGRFGDMYGIDGRNRGLRWDGVTPIIEPIGISRPLSPPSISLSSATNQGYVRSVTILSGGAGYTNEPTVKFTGGGLTDGDPAHANARAKISNARVVGMTITARGSKYTSIPTVQFSGGNQNSVSLSVGVSGSVSDITLSSSGKGYTSGGSNAVAATVSGGGITGCNVKVNVSPEDGSISSVTILASGTGATATPSVTFSTSAGSGAVAAARMAYRVASVTASSTAGTYTAAPSISFRPTDGGASALAKVAGGSISSIEVLSGGSYATPPTAVIDPTDAQAMATLTSPQKGVYRCAMRYIDDTAAQDQGPIPSSISDFAIVGASSDTVTFTWTWTNDGMEARADKIELWRTTADQSQVLYRVTTIERASGIMPTTYVDTLTDDELLSPTRDDFGIMPIVMPSGQINSRRFVPPPIFCSQAVMFQDRAWYSADTRKIRPNSLWHSEIDEPESVPAEYEIIVQESLGQQDYIVALIALGSTLLIAQSRNLYKMTYVSQPLIDASIRFADTRGIMNSRCYAILSGVAYIADYNGMYAFDGTNREDISIPVDNYWRDSVIDFTKAEVCFVAASEAEKVLRFYYCQTGDGAYPTRALCYCVNTKSWWEEQYAQPVQGKAVCAVAGRPHPIVGAGSGQFLRPSTGGVDATAGGTTGIPYLLRTGAYPLASDPNRAIGLLYKPVDVDANVGLRLHYNGSDSHRPNAVVASRGDGFDATPDGASLNINSMRSSLGPSPGFAQARYAGRMDEFSSGGDRHMAVAITGVRATTSPVTLYAMTIGGVTG